jgi:hypothetical protein
VKEEKYSYRWGWLSALAVFVLAGATGAVMRFGNIYGFPWGLQFANVRHAHSHLMYFGWVTPALISLIASQLPAVIDRPLSRRFRWPIIMTLIGGLLTYIPFLLYGYRPALIGERQIPLSVIFAGVNIVAWYVFIWQYWRESRGAARNYPLQLWDGALIFLIFASLGGWGLAIITRLPVEDPFWSLAFTHIFLDTFAFGWFILALLGLAYTTNPAAAGSRLARYSINLVVIGMPVIFLLGMPQHVVPPLLRWIGALGGLLVAAGLLGHIVVLWPLAGGKWNAPLFFLGLTAVTLLATLHPSAARWATIAGLRIPYLHWLLLGFVTLGLVSAAQEKWGEAAIPGRRWMTVAVILLIISLMPLTTLWPPFLRGVWTRHFNAWASLGPALVGAGILITVWLRRNRGSAPVGEEGF